MKSFEKQYLQYRLLVEKEISSCVTRSKPATLYEPMKYILAGGGKRIRPVLVMLACEAVGGKKRQALPAAAAIEILHNFTLVHDDIMDNAPTRRGRPTVHTKWDTNIAILVGDELVALAYGELLKTRSPHIGKVAQVFTDGVVEVCEGQTYDKDFETQDNVTLDDYILMIAKKTGKLVAVSLEIGAIIGGGKAREIQALRQYGIHIGRAFQIQDDLLDILADEKEFGKTIGGDIVEGKKTYLMIEAHNRAQGDDRSLIESIFRNHGIDRSAVPRVRDIYQRYGIIDDARSIVEGSIRQANRQLSKLKPSVAHETLHWFSEMLLTRKS
jgi:geranylgeranyl diphosphate synthase type II